jgi:hypothetical protein
MSSVQPDRPDAEVAQEVQRAWAGLLSAAGQCGYAVDELIRPPASAWKVAAAEDAIGRRLPRDLAFLYQLADGQADWIDLVRGPAGAAIRQRGRWVGSLFGKLIPSERPPGPLLRSLSSTERSVRDVAGTSAPGDLRCLSAH